MRSICAITVLLYIKIVENVKWKVRKYWQYTCSSSEAAAACAFCRAKLGSLVPFCWRWLLAALMFGNHKWPTNYCCGGVSVKRFVYRIWNIYPSIWAQFGLAIFCQSARLRFLAIAASLWYQCPTKEKLNGSNYTKKNKRGVILINVINNLTIIIL